MSARDGAKAKLKALTSLVWSGEEQREKNWQFEEKKGTWMGGGAKVGVRVQCTTCDTTLTFDGVYDSTTNELTFSRPDDADTWDGVIHFMHSRFLMDGPYIEWKHGQVWTAKNWKRVDPQFCTRCRCVGSADGNTAIREEEGKRKNTKIRTGEVSTRIV